MLHSSWSWWAAFCNCIISIFVFASWANSGVWSFSLWLYKSKYFWLPTVKWRLFYYILIGLIMKFSRCNWYCFVWLSFELLEAISLNLFMEYSIPGIGTLSWNRYLWTNKKLPPGFVPSILSKRPFIEGKTEWILAKSTYNYMYDWMIYSPWFSCSISPFLFCLFLDCEEVLLPSAKITFMEVNVLSILAFPYSWFFW